VSDVSASRKWWDVGADLLFPLHSMESSEVNVDSIFSLSFVSVVNNTGAVLSKSMYVPISTYVCVC